MSSAAFLKWMGLGQSGKSVADDECFDEGERYFGLENFGNTCYSNSVVQALYYCKPFRECITNFPVPAVLPTNSLGRSSSAHVNPTSPISPSRPSFLSSSSSSSAIPTSRLSNGLHNGMSASSQPSLPNRPSVSARSIGNAANTSSLGQAIGSSQHERDNVGDILLSPGMEDTLFAALKDLFWKIATHKKKTGVVAPVNFINKVKKENELFRSSMHQDAHEFLNYLLNSIAEDVERYQKKIAEESASNGGANGAANGADKKSENSVHQHTTWVHQLFEGVFSNETKCLTCETVTSRDESFMDLSIDVEMNSSVTSCLRQFSASETLCHKNKYFCDVCCGLQEAERRMKIKKLPNILALHLKRFKYQEQLQKYIKLTYRVVFPFELRLFNTCDDTEDPDRMYELWACVIHIGSGPHHGHYVTIIKSNGQWMLFDDDIVTPIHEDEIQKYFGDLPGSGSGYVLFYQAVDLTMDSIDLWNGIEMKANPSYMHANGLPLATPETHHQDQQQQQQELQSSHSASPSTANYPNRIDSSLSKAETRYNNSNPPSTPTSPLPPPLASEDKKSRWGLRKIMEKSSSKRL